MAMLDESNLLAMRARAAKFRTNHVGTKLNEAELHEFEALAEKWKQTPSELIRGLVLGEIERDKHPPRERGAGGDRVVAAAAVEHPAGAGAWRTDGGRDVQEDRSRGEEAEGSGSNPDVATILLKM